MKIERTNDGLIKVDGELWVRCVSARYGRCLLTGIPLRIGDSVYAESIILRFYTQRFVLVNPLCKAVF